MSPTTLLAVYELLLKAVIFLALFCSFLSGVIIGHLWGHGRREG